MKTSRLNRPHIKLLIAHGVANGCSQRQIAQELGTSQPTISRHSRQNDVLKMTREEEKRLCSQVRETLERIQNDPRFIADLQKAIEKKLLNSIPAVDINNSSIINRFAEIDAYRFGKHPDKPLPQGESAKCIGDNDLWIASTASILKATLLTTDKDFMIFDKQFLDVVYLDPEQFKEKH